MKAAITQLKNTLDALEDFEKAHRKEGNDAQADIEAAAASEFRQALAVLRAASDGPIWPEPQPTNKP